MSNLIDREDRPIGSELSVGPIGLGGWRLVAMPAAQVARCLATALDAGMNLIDTADVYGLDWGGSAFGEAEALLGEALRLEPRLRARMVLATKGGIVPGVPYDASDLIATVEASLQRLGVEQIDLWQLHRPDMLSHPAEIAAALTTLRDTGKIREVGVSNHRPSQTAALQAHLPFPIASQQSEYSATHLAPLFDGTFDQCLGSRQSFLAWSPLAGGRLFGDAVDAPPELIAALDTLAAREQVDRATLALAFTLAHPARPVALLGSTSPQRIQGATRALDVQLDRNDVYRIIQAQLGEALP